jgi:hypothetical protein
MEELESEYKKHKNSSFLSSFDTNNDLKTPRIINNLKKKNY